MATTRDSRARSKGETHVPITPDYVRKVFKGLENGDGEAFFEHVADDVDWIVNSPPRGSFPERQGVH
jgi:ketosteroid isomerase-like protein